jgi:hypothetical protein
MEDTNLTALQRAAVRARMAAARRRLVFKRSSSFTAYEVLSIFLAVATVLLWLFCLGALAECVGTGVTLKCVGVGPEDAVPQPRVRQLLHAAPGWYPSKEEVLRKWPRLQVGVACSKNLFVECLPDKIG